jgi:hypothetical protein
MVTASRNPIVISKDDAAGRCQLGKGRDCCSFLGIGPGGFVCLKESIFEPTIILRRAEGSIRAMGDHCQGPPEFSPIANQEESTTW